MHIAKRASSQNAQTPLQDAQSMFVQKGVRASEGGFTFPSKNSAVKEKSIRRRGIFPDQLNNAGESTLSLMEKDKKKKESAQEQE